ncbi:dienelactone hydrolase family protein [Aquipseudomonas alcaligenes]|uniref:Dienelactone hydrolase family protein n=1 Tax=Aquipseudomonas alcaligenes TaxID=43263 RepID=A0AA42N0E9_AQUAC|nr:dienelactone hydrolase family protein [Pseudomonas alcaligenes]MDH1054445.1 dienelactone hydrolase family protein [Pseudomonas alcaligenes]
MRPLLITLLLCCSTMAQAAIQSREVPYTAADGTRLVGYHAWDDAISGPRPGVIVVHEWWGLNDYAKRRARDLAALGYSALAVDMYGDGRNTQHPDDAKAFMNAALADPAIPKARFQAGLDLLKAQPQTDPARLAAIGYCFGGKVVLDMARQGLPLAAVVSFHGALVTATPATPGSVKAKVLVEHGAADSFITPEQIAAFKAEMDQAGADYRFVELPGAKHGFSNPDADAHKGHGLDLGYQKEADERSWADMQALFKDVF